MEESTALYNSTFQKILPLILALLLIFIIPMLLRRYGLEPGDLIKMLFSRFGKQDYAQAAKESKSKREPWQTNSRSQDLQGLVSTLLIFVRRNKLGLVYPGTVVHKGKMAGLVAILVTREEVIGINCFGYGGTISESNGKWNQHMNGADNPISSPLISNRDQYNLVRSMMDDNDMKQIPLRIVSVFTSRTVTVTGRYPREIFDTKTLIEHLKQCVANQKEEGELDPEAVSKQIHEHVQTIRKGGKGKK